MGATELSNANAENVTPIPDSKPYINTDSKPYVIATSIARLSLQSKRNTTILPSYFLYAVRAS